MVRSQVRSGRLVSGAPSRIPCQSSGTPSSSRSKTGRSRVLWASWVQRWTRMGTCGPNASCLGHANCPPPWPTFAPFYTQKEQCKKPPFFERVFSRPMKLGVQNTLSTLLLHDD